MDEAKIGLVEVDWEALEKEGLPRKETEGALEKMVPILFAAARLQSSRQSFLQRSELEKVGRNEGKLRELSEKYRGIGPVVQKLFAEQILGAVREAEPQFSIARFLVKQAERRGIVFLHSTVGKDGAVRYEGTGKPVYAPKAIWGMRVELYDPKTGQVSRYLPRSWKSEVHCRVAVALREYIAKCREAYKAAHPRPDRPAEGKAEEAKPAAAEVVEIPAPEPEPENLNLRFAEDLVGIGEPKPKARKTRKGRGRHNRDDDDDE